MKCFKIGDYAQDCPEILHIVFSKLRLMQGLGCAVITCCLLTRAAREELCSSSSPPQTWPLHVAHRALTHTAFRSVKRRGDTSFSSCFLALFSCWFSTHNLRDLCKTRLSVLFTRIAPLPTVSCVPCPPQSCSVCGVC